MRHVFFLSYASENAKDSQFLDFTRELCELIAPNTPWSSEDDRISFRDRKNLKLSEQWKPELRQALEASSVMVCLTSEAYYKKAFCGREFYIFEQRIKNFLGDNVFLPPAILPVIWAPHKIPDLMNDYVWKHDDMPLEYEEMGLRNLRWLYRNKYKKALLALATEIAKRWKLRELGPERQSGASLDFEQIPNAFGTEEWADAYARGGWIHGPTVANVVYGAGTKHIAASPKYGNFPREWKPYLPPHPQTVCDITKSVIQGQALKYRELPVDKTLGHELNLAQVRKNLIVVVADAATLTNEPNSQLSAYDPIKPEGTALLMPWDPSQEDSWKSEPLQKDIEHIFPIKSQTPACYRAPILSVDQFRNTLDTTLVEIRDNLTKSETLKKPITDAPPATVSGAVAL